ncbi:MAG: hypothetical protein ACRDLZ_02675 [Gaiellaceae bacterium]
MRGTNTTAVWALAAALATFAVFGGAVYAARHYNEVRLTHAIIAVLLALGFSLAAVVLSRRAHSEHRRSLGRSGSRGFLALVRLLATFAFLLALTAALALAVFAVLVLAFE